jgi:hypothetical protein
MQWLLLEALIHLRILQSVAVLGLLLRFSLFRAACHYARGPREEEATPLL